MKLKKGPKIVLIILVLLAFIFIGSAVFWMYLASPVDTNDKRAIEVVIPEGATASKIGTILKEKDLIKNEMFFKIYLKFNKKSSLKATTYVLKKNMSLDEIISALEKGNDYNPDVIKISFKEGKRLTEYVKLIAENTNHTESEIFVSSKCGGFSNDPFLIYPFHQSKTYCRGRRRRQQPAAAAAFGGQRLRRHGA